MSTLARLWLNGSEPQWSDLQSLATQDYGHYTSFIARGTAVRGWSLHRSRLREDSAALGLELDLAILELQLRTALSELAEGAQSVRISVFPRAPNLQRLAEPMPAHVLIKCSTWHPSASAPLRLRSAPGLRDAAQYKHLGLSAALLARRQAQLSGADDALLLASDGQIAEGPTWNIGLFDGQAVHWPAAPALPGTTQSLLSGALTILGVPCIQRAVFPSDLRAAHGVFACNARHACMPISSVDGHVLPRDAAFEALLCEVWNGVPWEPVHA